MKTDTINKPFSLDPVQPSQEQLDAAARLRQEQNKHLERREESWERSDTDGFLSQWASGMSARLNEQKASILENGGYLPTVALFEDDRVVKAKLVNTRFGLSWMLSDEEVKRFSRKFVPYVREGEKSRVHKTLGLRQGTVYQPAWCKLESSGIGLAGAASAYVAVFPIENPRSN